MKFNWILMFAFMLASCHDNNSSQLKETKSLNTLAVKEVEFKSVPKPTEIDESAAKTYQLQVTVLSFLQGGREKCDFTNKLITFSMEDRDRKLVLCKNSQVEVSAVSDLGVVTFFATDVHSEMEYPEAPYSQNQSIELGQERKWLRYGAEIPNAYAYVIAEDVTGVDPKLLKKWNELNARSSKLKEKVALAKEFGREASDEVLEELNEVELEMDVLKKKMDMNRLHPASEVE